MVKKDSSWFEAICGSFEILPGGLFSYNPLKRHFEEELCNAKDSIFKPGYECA
jgi:hypothetical protein